MLPHLIKPLVMLSTPNGSIDPLAADFLGNIFFDAAKGLEKDLPKFLEDIEKNKTSRDAVKKAMAIFGKSVSSAYEGMPLIIMVDELDRCKPSFAVAVLETIKHLFCVPNTVFVLAIEPDQIANCIAKTYGLNKTGSKAYLHKFIDMSIWLPRMDMHSFIYHTLQQKQFTLGIEQELRLPDPDNESFSFSIPEWIAAITYELLPSCREALKVMNQLSVLSYRTDMDFVSLLACAYAMSYRANKNCSMLQAIVTSLKCQDFRSLTHNPTALKIDNKLQYKNIFLGLINGRKEQNHGQLAGNFAEIEVSPRNRKHKYLLQDGLLFWANLGKFCDVKYENNLYKWNSRYGIEWRKQLEEFINFVEPSKEEGTPQ